MFWFFGPETCGILTSQPGIEPVSSVLEGEVLTTGLPGKSQLFLFFIEPICPTFQSPHVVTVSMWFLVKVKIKEAVLERFYCVYNL